ncbi:maternal protein exuperantia isoform X1 [Toxorhynchites rutilus septentrionalis]|uniref:maternal protein exuperantia isoform X1 n=1 Tax=Toxorhynchites rutilus septentrionalis TaxID=329112 RepID=UPI00247A7CC7|nr:maternal protein exuperantia isoform X1 [Toxorhynchites rutilus septentrionalis]
MVVTGIDESKVEYVHQLDESGLDDCDGCPAGTLSSKFDKTDTSINTHPLPSGKYTLIGIDIDTTGRRLIDEIVQISAYTPDHQYSQYIMPLMNLNPAARQRHQVRVITVGFFRMLKSMQTYRVVKSKTEVSALNEFIDWIEERRREDEGSDGVVLIYHEQRKFVPYMVIEALKKYNLLNRFAETVKSFANGFKLAEMKCSKTIKFFSIRQLAKLVLDESEAKDGFEGNAAYRARLAYQITRRLANEGHNLSSSDFCQLESGDEQKPDDVAGTEDNTEHPKPQRGPANSVDENGETFTDDDQQLHATDVDAVTGHLTTVPEPQPRSRPTTEAEREKMCTVLCDLASPITCEISELDEQETILLRQNSLRPVFLQYFKTTIYHRVKAVTYRRVLAEYGHDFQSLHQVWTEHKREGLEKIITNITDLKEEERNELLELLDCHFDPEKQQLKPIVKRARRRTSRGRPFFANRNNNNTSMDENNPHFNKGGNAINKENRKPIGGRNNANNTNNMNKNDMNNNNHKGSNMNQPISPNGDKKFRQRQPRRRRNNQDRSNVANFAQPQVIQASA